MAKSTQYTYDDKASQDLKKTAKLLGMSESDVLENGLAIMKCLAEATEEDEDSELALKQGNTLRPFKLLA